VILTFVLYFVAWFNSGIFYSGDGVYRRDSGVAAFQVEFPPVDLTRPGRSTFRFTRLAPEMSYVVGLRISGRVGHALATDEYGRRDLSPGQRPDGKVLIQLRNENCEIVFRESRFVPEWDWLRTMASIRGESREVPIGGGSVTFEWLNVGPDHGWGTHFTPRFLGRYTLDIVVEQPSTNAGRFVVHPVIEGYTALP